MRKFQKLCFFLATTLTLSFAGIACNGESLPNASSTAESENSPPTEPNPMWDLVDRAYLLGWNESLSGTHILTGTVTSVEHGSRTTIVIEVEGRENKPIQCYGIIGTGVTKLMVGDIATVSGTLKNYKGTIEFDKGCVLLSYESFAPPLDDDPYATVTAEEFYRSYTRAHDNQDAYYRSLHGFMSGDLTVPDQAPVLSAYQPERNGMLVRNSETKYSDNGNAYTVVDAYGEDAFTVYRQGAYVTLEEVAAFVYAFGTYPANYTSSKSTRPTESEFGEYLRVNHSAFSGDTSSYPYEPMLPNISGCGGSLRYFEMDIGTTGTDCDPSYPIETYNDGDSITRGAARIVYGKTDLNNNGVFEKNEHHLFYTYNHYNDFQEYLNYQGGWGEKFGNITGGGSLSSKTDYNPTEYIDVLLEPLPYATLSIDDYNALKNA